MEKIEPMIRTKRQRRIAIVVLLPLVAALVMWALESGDWLVVYNDSAEPITEISLRAGQEHWTMRELEPQESRRLRVHSGGAVEVVVKVTAWSEEPILRENFDWRYSPIVTLRLDSSGAITSTSERGIWQRALNW